MMASVPRVPLGSVQEMVTDAIEAIVDALTELGLEPDVSATGTTITVRLDVVEVAGASSSTERYHGAMGDAT